MHCLPGWPWRRLCLSIGAWLPPSTLCIRRWAPWVWGLTPFLLHYSVRLVLTDRMSNVPDLSFLAPQNRNRLFALSDCSIDSIEYIGNFLFIATNSGFFVQRSDSCLEKIVNLNTYSSDLIFTFVHFMTSNGICKYNLESEDAEPVLFVNLFEILNVLKSQISLESRTMCFNRSVLLYNTTRIV
jgi:hypothetical protein